MDDSSVWNNLVALHTNPIKWAGEGYQLFSSQAFENSRNVDQQKTRLEKQIKLLQDQEEKVYDRFLRAVRRMMTLLKGFGSYLIQNIMLICR